MLNYIKAELYKALHRPYLWVLLAVMLALEELFLWLLVSASFVDMVAVLSPLMTAGNFLVIPLSHLVVSGPYGSGTLKNELSFGLPRSRIYLGKLFTAILLGVALCAVLIAFYLGTGWLLAEEKGGETLLENLSVLAYVVAGSVPLWLGSLGICIALFFLLRSETGAVITLTLALAIGTPLLEIFQGIQVEPFQAAARFLWSILPVTQFGQYTNELTWGLLAKYWAIGLGWLAGASALGVAVFRRRDIR